MNNRQLFAIIVITLLICSNIAHSQVIYQQDLNEGKNGLNKGKEISLPLKSYLLVDFEIGTEGNIYIANLFAKEITILGKSGNKIKSISIPENYFKGYTYGVMDIVLDEKNNAYCLLTKDSNFLNLLFVDIESGSLSEIELDKPIEGRIRRFYYGGDGNLYFNTFPWFTDYNPDRRPNYVFNAQGKLLKTTDYYIITNNKKRYVINSDSKKSYIKLYAPNLSDIERIKESSKVRETNLLKEVSESGIRKYNWVYIGSDKFSNIYLTNASKIHVFDENLNTIGVFKYDSQITYLNGAVTDFKSLRISPSGDIYSVYVNPKLDINESKYLSSDITYNIVKIKDGGE